MKHIPIVAALLLAVMTAVSAEDESDNTGEDLTRPLNRFDVRMQYKSLPDADTSSGELDDRHTETLTLRSDLVFFKKPDQLALRIDMPFVWSNKPDGDNPDGRMRGGTGDLLLQLIYAHTFNEKWAIGVGERLTCPTASEDAFGNGKWISAPVAGVRRLMPEVSQGAYASIILRWNQSFAGDSSRSDVRNLIIEPQFNVNLPEKWFVLFQPQIEWNHNGKWFVPFDAEIGKKFGTRWVASVEYQYGLVRGVDSYHQWVEARIGYFF